MHMVNYNLPQQLHAIMCFDTAHELAPLHALEDAIYEFFATSMTKEALTPASTGPHTILHVLALPRLYAMQQALSQNRHTYLYQ